MKNYPSGNISLCVRKNYDIPTKGKVNTVFLGDEKITDLVFCNAIKEIYMNEGDAFEYKAFGDLEIPTETRILKKVYLAYENCPVATNYIGYIGIVEDKWAIILDSGIDADYNEESLNPYIVTCKTIPDDYVPTLQAYFKYY